jgi:6-phosphofructokinase 1
LLSETLGDTLFQDIGGHRDADAAIFTRKVGHTQRGGRPVLFDRYHASQLGAKAVELLTNGATNQVATIQWSAAGGFSLGSHPGQLFRDSWGVIHARRVDPSFYDSSLLHISAHGANYLKNIFRDAIGAEDVEFIRQSIFDSGNLDEPYRSVTVDMQRRICFLEE